MTGHQLVKIKTDSEAQESQFHGQVDVRELCERDHQAVMALLDEEPMRALHLRGLIDGYGLQSPAHRGRLFGYYEAGRLMNIALLGHHILIYKEHLGLREFAEKAAAIGASGHLILGPARQVEEFWSYLRDYGRETRLLSPQFWYVCRRPRLSPETVQLTLATLEQLPVIAEVQAQLAYEQSGVDPRVADHTGFLRRVIDRIHQQRTWVKTHDGKVIFKAELVCESPDAVYLESIWTHPDYRGQGVATSCVAELVNRFLFKKKAVCILVDPEEEAACRIYQRVGFVQEEDYQARFLAALD